MKKNIRKNLFLVQVALLVAVMAMCVLIYWLFAPSYYNSQKSKLVREAFTDLKETGIQMLDDSDESMIKQYENEGLVFTITDENFSPVYTNWPESAEHEIYKHILLCKEKFSKDPEVINRETKNPIPVKLMGLIEQDDEIYYVSIRERGRSFSSFFLYTEKFLLLLLFLSFLMAVPAFYLFSGYIARYLEKSAENTGETAKQNDSVQNIRRDVMADISHELKTPLTIISSQVEMLQCVEDPANRDYYCESIVEEVARMSKMVENLMDLSLMEHQIQEMERQNMNLTDTIEYIQLKYQALFQQNHIREEFSVEPNCKVRGNAYYLEQAIDNYMMNAFSHTAQGSRIRVRLYRKEGWIWVAVHNQGEEIEPSAMEQIWQGYVMKRTQQTEKCLEQRHMGMGLYLVWRIIQLHQGECGVENREKGVEFWFKIPEIL